MKTGALIIASLDLDGNHKGNEEMSAFLPMLHLDGTTAVKREIALLRRAGVSPIIVLAGYQADVLKLHLSHNGVIFLKDERFAERSKEEAIAEGLSMAREYCDRVLAVPVEIPAFSVDTVKRLLEMPGEAIPVYQGQRGYPRLLMTEESQDPEQCAEISVEDAGILYRLDEDGGVNRIHEYLKNCRESNELRVKMKVMLSKEEDFFGPGTYHLLKTIERTGSIQAAAAEMGMSYSKGWKMINHVEKEMGFPFLERHNGGKNGGFSALTAEGKTFVNKYHAMVEDMRHMVQNFFDIYFEDFQ